MTSFFILEGKAVADNKVPTLWLFFRWHEINAFWCKYRARFDYQVCNNITQKAYKMEAIMQGNMWVSCGLYEENQTLFTVES
jgi:hypothetical protein